MNKNEKLRVLSSEKSFQSARVQLNLVYSKTRNVEKADRIGNVRKTASMNLLYLFRN